jgi:hypothetical protein
MTKKSKHESDLWMVYKSSYYEQLAKFIDDILIWNKDLMEVNKSSEKTYISKSVGIPEYYLDGTVELLREAWNNQVLQLALSANTYI